MYTDEGRGTGKGFRQMHKRRHAALKPGLTSSLLLAMLGELNKLNNLAEDQGKYELD